MKGTYCGRELDTERDELIATARHDDGAESLYLEPGGKYYFVIDGRIGFNEPEEMKEWVRDHFDDPESILARMGGAGPVCSRGAPGDPAREAPRDPPARGAGPRGGRPRDPPGRAWYLLPVFLFLMGGLIMFFVLRDRDRYMARNGLLLGAALTAASLGIGALVG